MIIIHHAMYPPIPTHTWSDQEDHILAAGLRTAMPTHLQHLLDAPVALLHCFRPVVHEQRRALQQHHRLLGRQLQHLADALPVASEGAWQPDEQLRVLRAIGSSSSRSVGRGGV